MKFQFIVNDTVLFESEGGSLTVSKEVLDIGGFGGENFDCVSFQIVDDVAKLSFKEKAEKLNAEERKFVQERRAIMAIKQVRDRLGLTLREAKDVVDEYRHRNPTKDWGLS